MAGAFLGSVLGLGVAVLILNPQESIERLEILEEEQRAVLAIAELTLLTDLIFACDPDGGPETRNTASVGASGGGNQQVNETEGLKPTPWNTDRLVALTDIVVVRNEAWELIQQERFVSARSALAEARRDYQNSLCFRDIESERQISDLSLCEATDGEAGWGFISYPRDRQACDAGPTDLKLCDAIINKDGEILTWSDEDGVLWTTAVRILQACGFWGAEDAVYEPA